MSYTLYKKKSGVLAQNLNKCLNNRSKRLTREAHGWRNFVLRPSWRCQNRIQCKKPNKTSRKKIRVLFRVVFGKKRLARVRFSSRALHCTLIRRVSFVDSVSLMRWRWLKSLRIGAAISAGAVIPVVIGANGLSLWAGQDHVRVLLAVTGWARQKSTFTQTVQIVARWLKEINQAMISVFSEMKQFAAS